MRIAVSSGCLAAALAPAVASPDAIVAMPAELGETRVREAVKGGEKSDVLA